MAVKTTQSVGPQGLYKSQEAKNIIQDQIMGKNGIAIKEDTSVEMRGKSFQADNY